MASKTFLSSRKGFTIVELLIVIVVIGILASIVIISYTNIQSSARDNSVLSDLDALDGIQTDYGNKNGVAGKAWYSGNGLDASLNFTPSPGDVIDVVINSTDYCIRGYNIGGSKNKISNSYTKESSPGVCATIPASGAAISGSP